MKIFLTVLAVVALGSGYFYYNLKMPMPISATTPDVPKPIEVQTPEVQKTKSEITQVNVEDKKTTPFSDPKLGFSFTYRVAPYGYILLPQRKTADQQKKTLTTVTLARIEDYKSTIEATDHKAPHDGPPSITVTVFDAAGVTDINAWLIKNNIETNCEEGTVLATEVAGRDASSCSWDGLYSGITIGLLHNKKVYMLVGTREEEEIVDGYSYAKDFVEMVDSFEVSGTL